MSNGSRQRLTDLKKFQSNYDTIFRKPDPREVEDAQAEDEAFKIITAFNKLRSQDADSGQRD